MKKWLIKLLVVIFTFNAITLPTFAESIRYNKPGTSARAAAVLDVNTGRVLYAQNAHQKLRMASTTKIMTTLVAVESGKLSDTVKISNRAQGVEGSSIYLRAGEKLTVEELLYGVMLRSGNDAATAVAEYVGGTVDNFVAMMNKKAQEIGAKDTHFANPHGLDAEGHYTTAYDLALITAYALRNPKFKEIVSTKRKIITGSEEMNGIRDMTNKNKMLWQFKGGDGVKTGYTTGSGRCLVSSATRNNWQLVCAVLDCRPMWEDSANLLEYGFSNYQREKVVTKDQVRKSIGVKNGKKKFAEVKPAADLFIPLKEGERNKLTYITEVKNGNEAPILRGAKAGALMVYLDDKLLGTVDLVFCEKVEPNNPIYYMKKFLRNFNAMPY